MRIVLASKSPRRKEILENLGLTFEIITSNEEEKTAETEADKIAMALSEIKAKSVAKAVNDKSALIIGCDTIVVKKDKILGKPKTKSEAEEMLTLLSDTEHAVISGLTLVLGDRVLSRCEKTQVFFDKIGKSEMESYIATGDPFDKAGGYGIQGPASRFIKGINGCYFNVVGFPTHLFYEMIKELKIEL
ncbi:MAG: septum formation protein Maf [Ruminococcaceae bacterium]|nr:septum formation protein Maf [Oscillospiraceae bacterium]